MLISEVKARLADRLPDTFVGGISGALDLGDLMNKKAKPRTPAAFVLPLGFDAAPSQNATGLHQQRSVPGFAVVFALSSTDDIAGTKAVDPIEAMETSIVAALAGWSPPSMDDVINVVRGRLLDLVQGVAYYQINFSTAEFLRIPNG